MTDLLSKIDSPVDLRKLNVGDLKDIAEEVRALIIDVVSQNRGHLASNLGTVELTLALHYCFDFLTDRLVWDCGHQSYAHKIITGRRESFRTLRQEGGISGFLDPKESPYDTFKFGHTATSMSTALGLACGDRTLGRDNKVVAVIGDGAVASGMAFEALNHAGELDRRLVVVLNDNKMSISRSVGAIAKYLSKVRSSTSYTSLKQEALDLISSVPVVGRRVEFVLNRLNEGLQVALTPGGLFVEMGFHYFGPVDGHDVEGLVQTFRHLKRVDGPILLHVLTEKGHGFDPASADPTRYHSSKRFEWSDGTIKSEEGSAGTSFSSIFGKHLCELAARNKKVVAITAAMPDGTGLGSFAKKYRKRFYDVGICEQHGVGLAAGLSRAGLKPVFAVYSTFLQRAYDQLFHEVALQGEGVVFCIDRAGLVGSDGPTHHGLLDIAYARVMNGFVVMAPRNAAELRRMMDLATEGDSPAVIRYPREAIPDEPEDESQLTFRVGEAEVMRKGSDAAIVAYGVMAARAMDAADELAADGIETTVVNARFAQPLDLELIGDVVREHSAVVLAEDHSVAGGFGSAVLEAFSAAGIDSGHVRVAGVPMTWVAHAPRDVQLARLGLDGTGLARRVRELLKTSPVTT